MLCPVIVRWAPGTGHVASGGPGPPGRMSFVPAPDPSEFWRSESCLRNWMAQADADDGKNSSRLSSDAVGTREGRDIGPALPRTLDRQRLDGGLGEAASGPAGLRRPDAAGLFVHAGLGLTGEQIAA